ncbi:Uncharacterised protein [Klebsiella pneumoniae]|uniref:Uncharacterized protein n=1 Tax=Klebsiella pneumoniae TaxID=573 RepID=A0A378C9I9_KLEPN|nr:Uncharacterised protein [Klebsiella pneumoniae]
MKSFDVAAGTVSLTPEMLADEGDYIGVYTEGGLYFNTAGDDNWHGLSLGIYGAGCDTTLDTSTATGTYSYTSRCAQPRCVEMRCQLLLMP